MIMNVAVEVKRWMNGNGINNFDANPFQEQISFYNIPQFYEMCGED